MENHTRLEKSTNILKNSKVTQWCYVNTENEFIFMGKVFVIADSVDEYKVHNKAGTVEDYTNEAYMEEILVSIGNDSKLNFYNQNYDIIDRTKVTVKE
ncbi:hypothetical protein PQE75_gp106 [Bacillus phage vB_BcoS-136]|uniref:Uncharacterized protein n=1 Tax=Bacillus phage vB_BcoS-136 TaxID=2419619 RepID=A0A3G3BVG1_9CAUD|nr:hypothetical protein PQE75_gp106 [Bacillus phage vB_BcoS-136]AYP68238.1 hypothetical protein vBBcoS136_00106 [Bacillus phage vB_BcoS-136]